MAGEETQPIPLKQRANFIHDSYVLGPGDGLQIELLDLPELSGQFSIGPDGTLYCLVYALSMLRASLSRNCVIS